MQTRDLALKKHVETALRDLKTLRDEIRVQAHLLSMEAKQRWSEIEPHIARAEQAALEASEVSAAVLGAALQTLIEFQANNKTKRP